jgi:modification methylase
MREYKNRILEGDCVEVMRELPDGCVDAVFADPPYNLCLGKDLFRPDQTFVDAVDDDWDKFESSGDYGEFARAWLAEAKRVLKPNGAIWVIGSYHNIFKIGALMQEMGFWIINDIVWVKNNPMPNFKGTRFTNAHETLIWAVPSRAAAKYTFNYDTMKKQNGGKQMRSDWWLNICLGPERLRDSEGKKIHSTQKPMDLLERVILSTTKPGDIILDPFFGSGTTGAVAKKLHRNFIGIEREAAYISAAQSRVDGIEAVADLSLYQAPEKKEEMRIAFDMLLELGLLNAGQTLVSPKGERVVITKDGMLQHAMLGRRSIHQMAALLQKTLAFNGWDYWSAIKQGGALVSIDVVRDAARKILQDRETAAPKQKVA